MRIIDYAITGGAITIAAFVFASLSNDFRALWAIINEVLSDDA